MCLTEVPGQVPVTHLFARGDHQQPRQAVVPGELTILNSAAFVIPVDDPQLPTTGRRLAWARHLTSGQHPLVARVLVNRFWMHHFGRGLVATPGDFGVKGERPSHPELLDWLAADFMESGWSLKRLHRQILTSRAWRQSSVRRQELEAVDPENRLLGRMSVHRLEAETVRDALLAVSGQLNRRLAGPPVPVSPDEVGQVVLAIDTRDSAGRPTGKKVPLGDEEFRRSVYVQVRRSMPLGILEPFDLPTMTPNCEQRASSTGPAQALMMMNNPFVIRMAEAVAERVRKTAGPEPADQARLAWRLIGGRHGSEDDLSAATGFLLEGRSASSAVTAGEAVAAVAPPDTQKGADVAAAPENLTPLSHLCQALLCSNAFLYVD